MAILAAPTRTTHAPWCDKAEHETRIAAARDLHGPDADWEGCGSTLMTTRVADATLTGLIYQPEPGQTRICAEADRGEGMTRQIITLTGLTPDEVDSIAAWLAGVARAARQATS